MFFFLTFREMFQRSTVYRCRIIFGGAVSHSEGMIEKRVCKESRLDRRRMTDPKERTLDGYRKISTYVKNEQAC